MNTTFNWKRLLAAGMLSMTVSLLLCAGGMLLLDGELVPLERSGTLVSGILFLSALSGAALMETPWEILASGGLYLGLLLLLNGCLCGFQVRRLWTALLEVLLAGAPVMLFRYRKSFTTNHRRKSRIVKMNKKRR